MLNGKKPAFWIAIIAVVVCVVVFVCIHLVVKKDETPDVASRATRWYDSLRGDGFLKQDESREIRIDEYPGVLFCCTSMNMTAEENGEETPLYSGLPIMNVYSCDLNGDGKPELCSTVSIGCGFVDYRVMVYDYAKRARYELSDRWLYHYVLTMQEGKLYVEKSYSASEDVLESGLLVIRDDALQVLYDAPQ